MIDRPPSIPSVKKTGNIYLGIMTGTSLDAIDVAACRFEGKQVELVAFHSTPWPGELRRILMELATAPLVSMDELARTHFLLATEYARAVSELLSLHTINTGSVRAVGLHGQTIRHLPNKESVRGLPAVGATFQLGSGSGLAALTGMDVVSDFRSADVALGGQGAPLVPMFDWTFLSSDTCDRLVINIGGISNVTWLPAKATDKDVLAFDCGPGNMLLDSICAKYCNTPFDREGERARRGTIDSVLLEEMLGQPYFREAPPKSTGRELFGNNFLHRITSSIEANQLEVNDALATLTELTARSVARSMMFVTRSVADLEFIVSGGGAMNQFLLERIEANAREARVASSDVYGVSSKAKEAIAFAFFAKAFLEELPIHLPRTTGASKKIILGSHAKGSR